MMKALGAVKVCFGHLSPLGCPAYPTAYSSAVFFGGHPSAHLGFKALALYLGKLGSLEHSKSPSDSGDPVFCFGGHLFFPLIIKNFIQFAH